MVITRLKANLPTPNAFQFDKSQGYKISPEYQLEIPSVDVEDIVHEKGKGYIACGSVRVDFDRYGFLLRINEKLIPQESRYYLEARVFESCGFHHNKKGFVAVGAAQPNEFFEENNAIFISVNKDLETNLCALNVTGEFDYSFSNSIENKFYGQ